jgi:TctA family transporter
LGGLEAAFLGIFGIVLISLYSLFFIVWIFYVLTAFIMGITLFVFWLMALIDCIRRDEKDFAIGGDNAKLVWILLLILVRGIAGVVYYLVIMKNTRSSDKKLKRK